MDGGIAIDKKQDNCCFCLLIVGVGIQYLVAMALEVCHVLLQSFVFSFFQ